MRTQHDRLVLHALVCARRVRRKIVFPAKALLRKKPVRCPGVRSTVAGVRNDRRRLVGQPVQQHYQPLAQAGVTQIDV